MVTISIQAILTIVEFLVNDCQASFTADCYSTLHNLLNTAEVEARTSRYMTVKRETLSWLLQLVDAYLPAGALDLPAYQASKELASVLNDTAKASR